MPDRYGPMEALDALEHRCDFPLSGEARRIARCGSETRLRLIEATGQAEFFRGLARGQTDIIRRRRIDGSFYPDLIEDLELYRRESARWARRARDLRAELGL